MKILFINPHYPFEPSTVLLHPPLGFGYLANQLKKDNDVLLADLPLIGNKTEVLKSIISEFKPEVIGITCVTQSYCQALECAKFCKSINDDFKIILGGPHVTFIPFEVLNRHSYIDYLILYDGEYALKELMQHFNNKGNVSQLSKIKGIAYRKESSIIINASDPPIMNIDKFRLPDRSLFDMKWYLNHDYETVIMTSRGCLSNCSFCSTTKMGRKHRQNSIILICEEIEAVLKLGFSSIFFGDDTFAANKQTTIDLCEEIIQRKYNINFTCNLRAVDAQPEVLIKLKEAGGYRVFMGFETIDDKGLRNLNKGLTQKKQLEAVNLVKAHDLELHASFIVGAPFQTEQSLFQTIDYIKELNPTLATFNILEARPGTPLFNDPNKFGIIIPDRYWYESASWLDLPTCYTNNLSQKMILDWQYKLYSSFCSYD